MLTKEQRRNYLIISISSIAALLVVTLWQVKFQPASNVANQNNQQNSATALANQQMASQQILSEAVDQNQIQNDLQTQLGTDQKISVPEIADKNFSITSSNKNSVNAYLENLNALVQNYNQQTEDITKNLFSASTKVSDIDNAAKLTSALISDLYKLPVPNDALPLVKATINTYAAYQNIIADAKQYNLQNNLSPWKDLYYNYSIISNLGTVIQTQITNLQQKYNS